MNITYSRHARRRMRWRGISEQDIASAIESPDRIDILEDKRYNVFKMTESHRLKVSFKRENDEYFIITAVWKGE